VAGWYLIALPNLNFKCKNHGGVWQANCNGIHPSKCQLINHIVCCLSFLQKTHKCNQISYQEFLMHFWSFFLEFLNGYGTWPRLAWHPWQFGTLEGVCDAWLLNWVKWYNISTIISNATTITNRSSHVNLNDSWPRTTKCKYLTPTILPSSLTLISPFILKQLGIQIHCSHSNHEKQVESFQYG